MALCLILLTTVIFILNNLCHQLQSKHCVPQLPAAGRAEGKSTVILTLFT